MEKQDLKKVKLSWWPSPQDYNEAVQQPLISFSDFDLVNGDIFVDALGLPKAACGAFASVYRVRSNRGQHAVRCFLRNVSEQQSRYQIITDFVQKDDLPYTVSFEYLPKGIRIHTDWFPLLKMDWVSGLTLDYHIALSFRDSKAMDSLGTKFRAMCDDLRGAGIAHGDLQHGNIILCGEELRLVDYDGMFVPAMDGLRPTELGHRNYQHPQRGEEHFGPYLDNFSAWVIYASIRAISIDSSLFLRFQCGDDCLLFKREDFLNPEESAVFRTLENHLSDEIRNLARFIRAQLKVDPAQVPPLAAFAPDVVLSDLPPLAKSEPEADAVETEQELPDWLKQGALMAEAEQKQSQLPEWMREDAGRFVPTSVAAGSAVGAKGHPPELVQMTPRSVIRRSEPPAPPSPLVPQAQSASTLPTNLQFELNLILGFFTLFALIVFLSLVWLTHGLIIVGAFVAIPIFLLARFASTSTERDYDLVREGVLAHGKITAREIRGTECQVFYQFETSPGNIVTGSKTVSKNVFFALPSVGSSVSVLYNLESPSISTLYEACGCQAVL